MRRVWLSGLRCIGMLTLLASVALAQASSSLNGHVTDPSGAAVPGARVTVLRLSTGFTRSTRSNASGEYQFLALPPGTYSVTIAAKGFALAVQSKLALQVNSPATLNVALNLASAATTVQVKSSAVPLVNTTDASLGNVFNKLQISQLPIANRNVVQLLSLQPGVAYLGAKPSQAQSDFDTRSGAVDGIRSDQANVTLNGIDVNDQRNGYAFTSVLNVPPDDLREFRVTTADPESDAGHSGGAQVTMITRTGTDHYHGAFYEYNRNTLFSANDFFLNAAGQSRPALIRNVYGFRLGGPFLNHKLFFFVNYEGRQDRQSQTVTRTVPTATMRQGTLKYLSGKQVQTLTPTDIYNMGVKNNVPASIAGVDPAILKMLQSYPMPNSQAVGDGLNTSGYVFASPTPGGYDTYIARLDYDLSPNETLFGYGQMQNFKVDGVEQFPGQPPNFTNLNDSRGLIFGLDSVLTTTLVNNLRYGYIRQGGANEGSSLAPYVSSRNLDFPDSQGNYTNSFIIPDNNITDNLNWIKGNHTFQFGADIDLVRNGSTSYSSSFSNASMNTGYLNTNGFAGNLSSPYNPANPNNNLPPVDAGFTNYYDWSMMDLLGAITEYNAVFNYNRNGSTLAPGTPLQRNFALNDYELYGQDQWHITPNLTTTIGLRYVLEQPPYETNGNQVAACVANANGSCTALNLGDWMDKTGSLAAQGLPASQAGEVSFELGGPVNHGPSFWNWDYKDFAPRVGVAWAPNFGHQGLLSRIFGQPGQFSIRGGYDLMYEHFGPGIVNTFDQNGSFGLSTNIANGYGTSIDQAPRFSCLTCLPSTLAPTAPQGGFPQTPGPSFGNIAWGLDSAVKTPYVHELDLSLTRQIGQHQSLSISYVGTFGRRLPMQEDLAMPANQVDPKSHMTYFQAAAELSHLYDSGTSTANVSQIPFWQDMFGSWSNLTQADVMNALGFSAGCSPGSNPNQLSTTSLTATQAVYELWSCFVPNETTATILMDFPPSEGGVGLPPNATGYFSWYHDQYSSLYAWNNIGTSNYNALQVSYQAQFGRNLQTQFNYVYSKSLDEASDAERAGLFGPGGGGLGGEIINSWSPYQMYAASDFNTPQQYNANWIWTLPFGRGQWLGNSADSIVNALIGNWQFSGFVRWNSSFPANVGNGFYFPTNWELTGNAQLTGNLATMQTSMHPAGPDGNGPNMFPNPSAILGAFSHGLPGQAGSRNMVTGDGYFGIDTGLAKSFSFGESKALQIGWQTFNVTNSVRFDTATASLSLDNGSTFGNYTATLTRPRFMQLFARITF